MLFAACNYVGQLARYSLATTLLRYFLYLGQSCSDILLALFGMCVPKTLSSSKHLARIYSSKEFSTTNKPPNPGLECSPNEPCKNLDLNGVIPCLKRGLDSNFPFLFIPFLELLDTKVYEAKYRRI